MNLIKDDVRKLFYRFLIPAVLNDMVKAVYVQKPDKSSGKRVQKVIISYNYAGILPNELLNKFYGRCTKKKRHNRSYTVSKTLMLSSEGG